MEVFLRPLNIRLLQKENLFTVFLKPPSPHLSYSLFGFVAERLEVFIPLPLLLCNERRVFLSNRPPGLSFLSSREVRN
jgi:hypothetical protein